MDLLSIKIKKFPVYGQNGISQEFKTVEPIEIYVENVEGDSGLVQKTTFNKLNLPEQLDYIIQFGEPEKETTQIGGGSASVTTVIAPFFRSGKQVGKLKIEKARGYMYFGHIIPVECWNVEVIN